MSKLSILFKIKNIKKTTASSREKKKLKKRALKSMSLDSKSSAMLASYFKVVQITCPPVFHIHKMRRCWLS